MKAKLGDLCTICSSRRIMEKEYTIDGIPFVRGLEVTNKTLLKDDAKYECYISKERFDELKDKYGVPQIGDILITSVGTIGNLCYINKKKDFYFKDGNLIWFKQFKKGVYSKYLYYFMQSPYFKNQLNNLLIGAVQKALTMFMLSKIDIDLPEYYKQVEIADTLEKFDLKVENNSKIISELESTAKTLYDYWFLQFEFPNKEEKPYKSSGGKMVYNEELKLEIPEGWKTVNIGKILCESEKSKVQVSEAKEKGDYPFFTSGESVLAYDEFFVDKFNIFLNTGGNPDIKAYMGKCAYSTDTWCINADKYSYTLYYYFLKLMPQFEQLFFAGSGLKHLQKDALKSKYILLPEENVLNQFNNICYIQWRKISKCIKENKELASLRDFLLPMLMNGQATF